MILIWWVRGLLEEDHPTPPVVSQVEVEAEAPQEAAKVLENASAHLPAAALPTLADSPPSEDPMKDLAGNFSASDLRLLVRLQRMGLDPAYGERAVLAVHSGKRNQELRDWIAKDTRNSLPARLEITKWARNHGYIETPVAKAPPPAPKRTQPLIPSLEKSKGQ